MTSAAQAIRGLTVDDEPRTGTTPAIFCARARGFASAKPPMAREAVSRILDPADLVFLDIQIARLHRIRGVERLSDHKIIAVVFVTAHDDFALKAFEVNAVDYPSPFDRERFGRRLIVPRNGLHVASRRPSNKRYPVAAQAGLSSNGSP